MKKRLRVFTCVDHKGHWPVGTASVIVALDEHEARQLLTEALIDHGISDTEFSLQEVDLAIPNAMILCDGDY